MDFQAIWRYLFSPETSHEIQTTFAVWALIFLTINILWDAISTNTPTFTLEKLSSKIEVIFYASAFSSGLILLLSVWNPQTKEALLLGNNASIITISAVVGVLYGLSHLSPAKTKLYDTAIELEKLAERNRELVEIRKKLSDEYHQSFSDISTAANEDTISSTKENASG